MSSSTKSIFKFYHLAPKCQQFICSHQDSKSTHWFRLELRPRPLITLDLVLWARTLHRWSCLFLVSHHEAHNAWLFHFKWGLINFEVSLNLPFRKFPSIFHPVVFNHGWLFHEFIITLRITNQIFKIFTIPSTFISSGSLWINFLICLFITWNTLLRRKCLILSFLFSVFRVVSYDRWALSFGFVLFFTIVLNSWIFTYLSFNEMK